MKERFLEAGEIVGTHGVRGEVKILPWADGPESLTDLGTVYLDGVPYEVESARVHKSMVLAKLRGVDGVEAAQKLRGKTVRADRSDLFLEEGAVFIADLIGLPVFAGDRRIGTLSDVLTLPGNDVYVVRGEHEYMIPAVSEFLEDVDADGGVIRVKLIEGMRTDEN